ncbi:MAG: right-handed parallel beta-helix repeat-containing protein, partial [Planctomycetota bacterium]
MYYFYKHWRGQLSLGISFWINCIIINAVLSLALLLNYKQVFTEYPVYICRIFFIISCISFFVVLPWQFVGLWRSGTNHIQRYGRRFWPIVAKTIVIIVLLFRIGQIPYYWFFYQDSFRLSFLRDDVPGYEMDILADGAVLYFKGGLPFGTSKEVEAVFDAYPDIETVILDSRGGRIYEARKVAELILQRDLDTCTAHGCFANATIPFAAGTNRSLCKGARLGFLQYYPPEYFRDFEGIQREYYKDWGYYLLRGVTKDFQEKRVASDPNNYWMPDQQELIDGGMVHTLVELSDILPMEEAIVFGYGKQTPGHKEARDYSVTDEQIKGWILGCSGPLWEFNRDGFDLLGAWKAGEHRAEELKETLPESWSIHNRNDLLKDLFWLSQGGGHRDDFDRHGRFISTLSDEELETYLEPYKKYTERCNELRIAHQYYEQLGHKGIIGWDLSRYICLCRWGYIVGYLDEETAWELMIPIALELQQIFDSWEELGQNYLIGRHYWSLKHVEKDKEQFDEAFWRLKEMPSSPWNKYPWDLDLSDADSVLPTSPEQASAALESETLEADEDPNDLVVATAETVPFELQPLPPLDFSRVNRLSQLKQKGPVLVVPDMHKTIQGAVNAAKRGDAIFVKAGVYDEWVLVKRKAEIQIVGENTEEVIIQRSEPNSYELISFRNCQDVTVSDLTLYNNGESLQKVNSCATISGGRVNFLRCKVTNECGSGIQYYDSAKGVMEEVVIDSCQSYGIYITGSDADVTISACHIRNNGERGCIIDNGAEVKIDQTAFDSNKNTSIEVLGATAVVRKSVFEQNKGDGFHYGKGASGTIEDCVFKDNIFSGIIIRDKSSHAVVKRSQCLNNDKSGIRVVNGASAQLQGNLCQSNKQGGIEVYHNGASADLKNNCCLDNQKNGMGFSDGGTGTIEDCVFKGNKLSGIFISDKSAHVVVKRSQCVNNDKSGIRVFNGASAQLQGNLCQSNKQGGIQVYQNGASADLKNNRCVENKLNGISFSGSGIGTIEDCVFKGNKLSGVFISDKSTHAVVKRSQCLNNDKSGIRVFNGASAQLQGNLCQSNKQSGIEVYRSGASAVLKNNRC